MADIEVKQTKTKKTRKPNVIYDNIELYSAQGKLVGHINENQMDWYLAKGLAEKMKDTDKARAIKLNFETTKESKTYNLRVKRQNKCYVCSTTDNLMKFNVIPYDLKKLLPETWKSHNSLDILSLCKTCQADAMSHKDTLRNQMYDEYEVSKDYYVDKKKYELKTLATKILNRQAHKEHNLEYELFMEEMENKLGHVATDEELKTFAEYDTSIEYKGTKSPDEYIMKQVVGEGDEQIKEFIRTWKDYFVEMMAPDDLPEDFYLDR